MAIVVKSSEEIDKIRKSSRIVAEVLEAMKQYVKPGVSTGKLDAVAEEIIRSHGATPSFKNYHGYPASICASVDDCVIMEFLQRSRFLRKDKSSALMWELVWTDSMGMRPEPTRWERFRTWPGR